MIKITIQLRIHCLIRKNCIHNIWDTLVKSLRPNSPPHNSKQSSIGGGGGGGGEKNNGCEKIFAVVVYISIY